MTIKIQRPKLTKGETKKKVLGCGDLYVTINGDGNGHDPIEVMVSLGKAGSCTKCQNEALTRMITLGLRYGVPTDDIIEDLKGIECPSKNLWPEEERALSCADAIARAIEEYVENRKI